MSDLVNSFSSDFLSIVEKNADSTMLIDCKSGSKFSYSDVDIKIKSCMLLLTSHLPSGKTQSILSLLPNSIETLIIFFSVSLSDSTYAPCHELSSIEEVKDWVSIVKPTLCVAPRSLKYEIEEYLNSESIPIIFVSTGDHLSWMGHDESLIKYSSKRSKLLLKTSGTTGSPKAMCLNINTLWSGANSFVRHNGAIDEKLRYYNFLPMSYLGGLFNLGLIPLVKAGSIVIDESFSAKTYFKFWKIVEKYKISILWLVPTIINGLLSLVKNTNKKAYDNNVKLCLVGTAPIKLADKELFEREFGIPVRENYGLSETTFISSENLSESYGARNEGSVGNILPYVDLKLVPIENSRPDINKKFNILVKTPFLFDGYLSADGSINKTLDADNYFRTGDIGIIEGNRLSIIGRSKDIIKKGGNFVSLREIELVVEKNKHVLESAAVSIPHSFYGESVLLYIVLNSPESVSIIQEIYSWLGERISKYKMPDKIIIKEQLPKTTSGKIIKIALQDC
jgi:acyl-coenzyme A synthetase/AMP-(fatty) acid ligase